MGALKPWKQLVRDSLHPDDVLPDSNGENGDAEYQKKRKPLYSNLLLREVTEEELSKPGALRLLLDDLERVKSELYFTKKLADKYTAASTEVAVLKERINSLTSFSLLPTIVLPLGGLLLGLGGHMALGGNHSVGWLLILVGALLFGTVALHQHSRNKDVSEN